MHSQADMRLSQSPTQSGRFRRGKLQLIFIKAPLLLLYIPACLSLRSVVTRRGVLPVTFYPHSTLHNSPASLID